MEATAMPTTTNRASGELLQEKAAKVRQDVRELGTVARDVASEKFDQFYKEGREKAIQLEQGLENSIREHPLQSVMIAAGVGFLAGFLVSRRR